MKIAKSLTKGIGKALIELTPLGVFKGVKDDYKSIKDPNRLIDKLDFNNDGVVDKNDFTWQVLARVAVVAGLVYLIGLL